LSASFRYAFLTSPSLALRPTKSYVLASPENVTPQLEICLKAPPGTVNPATLSHRTTASFVCRRSNSWLASASTFLAERVANGVAYA